jgi:hypothetical protein
MLNPCLVSLGEGCVPWFVFDGMRKTEEAFAFSGFAENKQFRNIG